MITYNTKMRQRAKEEHKGLFAVGYDTPQNNAVFETPLEHDTARQLFQFCTLVIQGEQPEDALRNAFYS